MSLSDPRLGSTAGRTSTAGVTSGLDSLSGPRSLADLHRDVWRAFAKNPAVFVILPLLAWLPFDVGLEWAATLTGDGLSGINTLNRLERILNFTLGTALVTTTAIAAMRMGQGHAIDAKDAFSKGVQAWTKTIGPLFLAGLLTMLGTLCFIIPGLILLARMSLVVPVVLFEGERGAAALSRSNELVKRLGTARVLAYGVTTYICYLGLSQMAVLGYSYFVDASALGSVSYLIGAILTGPANLLPIGLTLGTVMLYHDAIALQDAERPESTTPAALYPFGLTLRGYGQQIDAPESASVLPLAAILLAGAASLAVWVLFVAVGLGLLEPSALM